jgi:hypothetical protein
MERGAHAGQYERVRFVLVTENHATFIRRQHVVGLIADGPGRLDAAFLGRHDEGAPLEAQIVPVT